MRYPVLTAVLTTLAVVFVSAGSAVAQICTEVPSVPAIISKPGLYCLKHDLAYTANTGAAITIAANNVTLDLNGFRLGGAVGGVTTYADGITASGKRNITIRNGTIRAFRANIALLPEGDGSENSGHLIEDLRIEGARSVGIHVGGWRSIIRNNMIIAVDGSRVYSAYGILLSSGDGSTIAGNMISGVTAWQLAEGIRLFSSKGATVEQNRIFNIRADTPYGIRAISGMRFVVRDNIIFNDESYEATAIDLSDAGSGRGCVDNVIASYETPVTGCDSEEGNLYFQ